MHSLHYLSLFFSFSSMLSIAISAKRSIFDVWQGYEYASETTDSMRLQVYIVFLTHQQQMSLSYRNRSIDLLWKSIDWFLYGGGIGC